MTQQIITITKTDFEKIVNRLEKLEKQVKKLSANIPQRKKLKEGSDAWWEEQERLADEDLKAGRYTTFKSIDEFQRYLDSSQ